MERLLTIRQLSDSIQISPKTIYQWTHTGFIPHYKLPKGVRFRKRDVESWLNSKHRKGRDKLKISLANSP